ncbi:right-handed parallel beta-helix repeat-containing protein [Parapedobacter sp.]
MTTIRILYVWMACCLLVRGAYADTYYVDARDGDDRSSGRDSIGAWRTLGRVNRATFQPGDTLLFRAGRIYEGQLKPQGAGSEAQPIVVANYGEGYKPRLQAHGRFLAAVHLYNVSGWQLSGLDISNHGPEREAGRAGVIVEIKDFGVARAITLRDLDIHDVNGSLVKDEGGGAGIIVKNGGRDTPSWYEGLTIEHNTIKRTHRNGILINGYWNRDNWHPSLAVVIRHNLLEGVPGDGIVPIGCDSALIEWNVMRDCPRLLPDGEAAAGIWPWSCDNTVIQFNEVSDHKAPWDAQGFDSDWNCRNTLIQYNYSHDNEGGFLLVCNDGSASPRSSVGNTGTIVRYNVSVNDGGRVSGKHAGFSPVIHLPGPTFNTKIYNNVLLVPAHRHPDADSTLIAFDNWHGYPDSTLIANNIFYALSPVDYADGKATRTFYRHNLYHGKHIARPDDPAPGLGDPLFVTLEKVGHPGMDALREFLLRSGIR